MGKSKRRSTWQGWARLALDQDISIYKQLQGLLFSGVFYAKGPPGRAAPGAVVQLSSEVSRHRLVVRDRGEGHLPFESSGCIIKPNKSL